MLTLPDIITKRNTVWRVDCKNIYHKVEYYISCILVSKNILGAPTA